jgi:hypothetical protein
MACFYQNVAKVLPGMCILPYEHSSFARKVVSVVRLANGSICIEVEWPGGSLDAWIYDIGEEVAVMDKAAK